MRVYFEAEKDTRELRQGDAVKMEVHTRVLPHELRNTWSLPELKSQERGFHRALESMWPSSLLARNFGDPELWK